MRLFKVSYWCAVDACPAKKNKQSNLQAGGRRSIVMAIRAAISEVASADNASHFELVRLSGLMKATEGASRIAVALIDGPVAVEHPSLNAARIRVVGANDGVACTTPAGAACNHGTFVAGVLHARRDTAAPGICPGCTLLLRPIFTDAADARSEDLPSATPAELASAILDVIAAGARVINLSVGLAAPPLRDERLLEQALQEAASRGAVVVAAAGNQGTVGGSAITRHPWVVPVVACDRQGWVLPPSNLGASIGRYGVAAPGHNITSLASGGGLAPFSGTSAAVPFVAGTAALLWSLFPQSSATRLRLAIMAGPARRRSVAPPLLDASAAYQALSSTNAGVTVA
jgi:subtilisin family serine protease